MGLRLGSTPMTIRGAGAQVFRESGALVAALLARGPDAGIDDGCVRRMREIAAACPIPFQ